MTRDDSLTPAKTGIRIPKDPVSAYTHMLGMVLSIAGLVVLVHGAVIHATPRHVAAFSIFGLSLILLYTASTLYHLLDISEKINLILRKIDHIMIYILIAGTFTPICLIVLKGIWGWSMLIGIWLIALAGLGLTLFWFELRAG
jgi:hemolysin III